MAYYTLLIKDEKESPWEIYFGDYERGAVEYEKEVMEDKEVFATKIIRTKTARQVEIDAAVQLVNLSENDALPEAPKTEYPGFLDAKDLTYLLGIMSAIVRSGDAREIRTNGECVTIAADLLDISVARVRRACGWSD